MTKDLTAGDIASLKKQISLHRNGLGDCEFELSMQRAREKAPDAGPPELDSAILAEIDELRKPFTAGQYTFSTDQWRKIYGQSEVSARAILLSGSSDHKQLSELLGKAEAAKRAADTMEAELGRHFDEFLRMPEAAAALEELAVRIQTERAQLELSELQSSYRNLYKTALINPERECADGSGIIQLIVIRDLRLEVLKTVEAETQTKFEALKRRNLELAKKLGRAPHRI